MTTRNIAVRVLEDDTWVYVYDEQSKGTHPIAASMDVTFDLASSRSYTVTIDDAFVETVPVADSVDMARLRIHNRGESTKRYSLASSAGYLQRHMSFPASSHSATSVDVLLDEDAGAPASADITSELGDPKFTIRPAKPPPSSSVSTKTGSFDATLVWNGSAWSASSLICAVGGRLEVQNTSGAVAGIVMKNDRAGATSSGIELELKVGGSAVLDFGYPSSGQALAFEGSITTALTTANVDVVYASYFTQGQALRRGASLRSPNGEHVMIMRFDGNLCVYPTGNPNAPGTASWGAFTPQTLPSEEESFLELGADGHLRIVAGTPSNRGQTLWKSDDKGEHHQYCCALDDDGALRVYKGSTPGGTVLWSSDGA